MCFRFSGSCLPFPPISELSATNRRSKKAGLLQTPGSRDRTQWASLNSAIKISWTLFKVKLLQEICFSSAGCHDWKIRQKLLTNKMGHSCLSFCELEQKLFYKVIRKYSVLILARFKLALSAVSFYTDTGDYILYFWLAAGSLYKKWWRLTGSWFTKQPHVFFTY